MYIKIEEEFKKKSLLRLSQAALFGTYFLLAIPSVWLSIKQEGENFYLWIFLYAVLFYVGVYIFIIVRVHKSRDFSWKNVLDINVNIKLYQMQVHDNDIKILKDILRKHNINTRPKQLEAIRHYQTLIPRNVVGGSSFLSVLAFAISIIALTLEDKVYYNMENFRFVFSLLGVISLIYLLFYLYNKSIFKLFGSVELYKRLEASISEIYMNTEKPSKKHVSKTKLEPN